MTGKTKQQFDTAVIGGGQAGLAIGYYLHQQNRDFVILESNGRIGDVWRGRWESLRLFTQAQYSSLPGMEFPAPDDYYPTKDEMANYLEAYALQFDLPVYIDTLSRNDDRYLLADDSQRFIADNVVVATGFHHPNVPVYADQLDPPITHIHSSEYRTPDQLPDGDVLVVGAGNSGAEIAVELAASGRCIWLSGRDTGRIPLGFFNSRPFWWVASSVLTVDRWVGRTVMERNQGGDPLIRLTSSDIRRAGVERVPRTEGVVDGKPHLDNGRVLDVDAVIWATGFRPDFSWFDLPELTFDAEGYPSHDKGVAEGYPGLYFLGLPFQRTIVSATIDGVGADAQYIAEQLPEASDGDVLAAKPAKRPCDSAVERC